MKLIGIIPARMGSERIKGKNMVELGGKPLLSYTIEAARDSGVFDEIVVTTNWRDCMDLASALGVSFIERPDVLCESHSTDFEFVEHALEYYFSTKNKVFTVFFILRPTSPFRTAETIRRALEEFKIYQCDSMRAVSLTRDHPEKSWVIRGNDMFSYTAIKSENKIAKDFWRQSPYDRSTQSLDDVYCQNGCIHVALTSVLIKYRNVSGVKISPFFTTLLESVNIDTQWDLDFSRFLIETGRHKEMEQEAPIRNF